MESTEGNGVYDNSASFALSGSAVTLVGHSAGLVIVTVGGVLFLTVGAVLAAGERLKRRRSSD
jgi:hypothetical protein